jgi:hypothetical protein
MAVSRHVDQIMDVTPSSPGCERCLAVGRRDWVHLRVCQACGHVGCCDDSLAWPRHRARQQTSQFYTAAKPCRCLTD